MKESTLPITELSLSFLTDKAPLPRLALRSFRAVDPAVDPRAIARFRDQHLVNPSGINEPTVLAIDLASASPPASALFELVAPIGQAARSGAYGPLAVVVCSSD